MTTGALLDESSLAATLAWAAQKKSPLTVSLLTEDGWHSLRSSVIRNDPEKGVFQIVFPIAPASAAPPEITVGQELGIALRRGHKKCVFVSRILLRRADKTDDGEPVDTLLLKAPTQMRELQRRVYQRVVIPAEYLIPVKLWHGGLPNRGETAWPLCSGRLSNVSLGGILLDIAADQNPQLGVGDLVGVQIKPEPDAAAILVEAQYRHCLVTSPGRIGIGLQFIGLEHDRPGRTSITEIAQFVKHARQFGHVGSSNRADSD